MYAISTVFMSFTRPYLHIVEFDPGCEAMIYTTEGTPLQGITGGFSGDRRVEYIIPLIERKRGTHSFVIESSCNGMFGVPNNGDTVDPPDMNRYFTLASADLVAPNQDAWRLMWDFETIKQISESLPGNTSIQNKALVVANEILNNLDVNDPECVNKCRKIAEQVFGRDWDSKQEKIYDEGPDIPRIIGIGHCHIDSAWLWPYSVTQQKVARSWSTQVDLMDRYPEHRFTCSSAQQYKWLETLYPKLFENVKAKVLTSQFQPVGGSWVENDGNMPSGEALARQLIFGQRFFESRFGKRCESGWSVVSCRSYQ
jgi:alpha-mannosidase